MSEETNFLKTALKIVRDWNYAFLLGLTVFLATVAPAVEHSMAAQVLVSLFIMLAVLVTSISVSQTKMASLPCLGTGGLCWLLVTLRLMVKAPPFTSTAFHLAIGAIGLTFLISNALVILRDVFKGEVTGNRICGAICFYLLMGLTFGVLYAMLTFAEPASFRMSAWLEDESHAIGLAERPPKLGLLVYYSFVTLATLGFGDITPATKVAMNLTWIESVSGQFYLSILVARLVGLHIASSMSASVRSETQ